MARIYDNTLTASGNAYINLRNHRGTRNIYTVALYGGFGGGTVTAFLNFAGATSASGGTTDDIALLDAGNTGSAISKTAKYTFNFECNSDPQNEAILKIILAGATNPTLKIRVYNIA